ncbi:hypothetical protein AWENTII_009980 [Aspergillus wentii]
MRTPSDPASRIGFLFKSPKKWTPQHIQAVNLREIGPVPASDIVGATNLPDDSDSTYSRLARDFTKPTKEEIIHYSSRIYRFDDSRLDAIFNTISISSIPRGDGVPQSGFFARSIMKDLRWVCDFPSKGLWLSTYFIPFQLANCHIRGKLHCDGAITREGPDGNQTPLAIYNTAIEDDEENKMKCEIPFALFLLAIAFDENPNRESYTSFVITVNDTSLRFTKAVASKSYLESLFQGRHLTECLEISRSRGYDILEVEGRRDFLRIFLGLLQCMRS